jgi:asparagine synthetase B (glutamine-hydrolysing)
VDELADKTRTLLAHSAEHKFSGNRAGVLLSGGLDSSIVALLASNFAETVHPIHFTPPKGSPASDVEYAKLISNTISTELIELKVEPREDPRSLLDQSFSSRLPYSHIAQAPHANAAYKLAEHGATLLATGNLADAAFGPSCHNLFDLKTSLNRLPLRLKAAQVVQTFQLPMPDLGYLVGHSIAGKLKRTMQIKEKWASTESLELLTVDAQKVATEAWGFTLDQEYDLATASALYATQSQVEYFMTNCLLQDVLSPAGLGLANIFACREVLEFGLSVPPFFRAHAHNGRVIVKPLLRSAFAGELPAA